MKSLVIVESPAKARTINKYLGKDYVVKSSVGHIRDLPVNSDQVIKTGAKISTFDRMGIYPDQDWKANYQVLPGKEKVVKELRQLAKQSDSVYLATDLDREGEAIAWHLKELLEASNHNFRRVIFNEITKKAVTKAFADAGELDGKRVEAQQARRFLDRLVGFMVSPVLWNRVARGLSAGRVQSVAVRLIVEREHEIQQFVPREYWRIFANLAFKGAPLRFELTKERGKKFACGAGADAAAHKRALEAGEWIISEREVKPASSHPPPPFITASLQQAGSTLLGFGVRRTMVAAQKLYESGWITYMRTDSTFISADALDAVRGFIGEGYGNDYLPEKPNFYASKAGAQEAHEAIRPSDISNREASLGNDENKLYQLIWKRFVASQMTNARYQNTTLTIAKGDYQLEAKGRVMLFDGFTTLLGRSGDKDQVELPNCKSGDTLELKDIITNQHFTTPPVRYSEASLVKELEKRGIGRPSTYASIISTIQERGYVKLENKRMRAEKIGEIVTDLLNNSFDDLMDYAFTAQMEEKLDEIAAGERDWKGLLDAFFTDLNSRISATDKVERRANAPVPTKVPCIKCDREMQIRFSKTGVFLGCPGYAEKGEAKCSNTLNLIDVSDLPQQEEESGEALSRMLLERKRCPLCNLSMTPYLIDNKRKLHVCGNSPACPGNLLEEGEFVVTNSNLSEYRCHKCDSQLELKSGRFGKFFACSNQECGATRGMMKNGKPAPPKMTPIPMPELKCAKAEDHFVLRDGLTGLFLAASSYPKHRETRPVKVAELLPHREELDSKYHFLLSAPKEDENGNPTIVRYSRKNNQIYVGSETPEGKATKWSCRYSGGRWG